MAKPRIDVKIMVFTGTDETTALVNELAHYTDNIYAILSDDYGRAQAPGGNITVIRRHLDEGMLNSWIDDTGIGLVIDGCAPAAAGYSSFLREFCEKKGVEYIRIMKHVNVTQRTEICRSREELLRTVEYMDHILVKSDISVYDDLTRIESFGDKIVAVIDVDRDLLGRLLDMGYRRENIICVGRNLSVPMIVSVADEYDINRIVVSGTDFINLFNYIDAADIRKIKISVDGEIRQEQGYNVNQVWGILAERFGITEDY